MSNFRGWCLGVLLVCSVSTAFAQPAADRVMYIHVGALLDRPGQALRGASTLVIRGSQIAAVLEGHVAAQPGASTIDLGDQFVLPGLIDTHVHMFSDDDKLQARLERMNRDIEDDVLMGVRNARRTLEAGFTTVRDLGSDIHSITALRDAINSGKVLGPTIVPAGQPVAVTAGHGDPTNNVRRDFTGILRDEATSLCDGADDCRRAVRSQVSQGAEVIKFTATGGVLSNIGAGLEQQLFPDEMRAIVETAHLLGLKVAAHAHGPNGIAAALEAGVDSIEHGIYTNAETNALFRRSGAWLVPTLLASSAALDSARATRSQTVLAKAEQATAVHQSNIAAAIEAGVRIAFGTDTGVSSHGKNAQEFALLVKAGLTPAEAIEAATSDAAELLGRASQIGTLELGRDADIIAVAMNPLEDVTELERVRFVMRRGIVHKIDGVRLAFPPVGTE